MEIVDYTARAPASYRVRERDPDEVVIAALHQTGCNLSDGAATRVKAHLLVRADGAVWRLHPTLARLRYGTGRWNARCVTIELEGSFPGRVDARDRPVWYRPERFGADRLADRPAQVEAALALLADLRVRFPALRLLGGHRQEAGTRRAGCPGPDVWSLVAEPALEHLGFALTPTERGGLDIPADWRRAPTLAPAWPPVGPVVGPEVRGYVGPLDALEPSPLPGLGA